MAFVVAFQQSSGCFQFAVMPQTGEYIEDFAVPLHCVPHAVCGEQMQMQRFRQAHRCLIAMLFYQIEMTLQFDINIFWPEERRKCFYIFPRFLFTATKK